MEWSAWVQFSRVEEKKSTFAPTLILPHLTKSFEVYCDACGQGLGCILIQ